MNLAEQVDQIPDWILVVVSVISVFGGGAGLVGLVLSRANHIKLTAEARKVTADAADVVSQAATALIRPLEERLTAAEGELEEVKAELRVRDGLIDTHSGWDWVMEQIATDAGRPFPPRPPLRPARQAKHAAGE